MDRFLRAQCADPFDPAPMLIHADWLEEAGDAAAAAALRGPVASGFPSVHALAREAALASVPFMPDDLSGTRIDSRMSPGPRIDPATGAGAEIDSGMGTNAGKGTGGGTAAGTGTIAAVRPGLVSGAGTSMNSSTFAPAAMRAPAAPRGPRSGWRRSPWQGPDRGPRRCGDGHHE